jgi:hypothetical protein
MFGTGDDNRIHVISLEVRPAPSDLSECHAPHRNSSAGRYWLLQYESVDLRTEDLGTYLATCQVVEPGFVM